MAVAHQELVRTLREAALAYPETNEDFPWGESAFKVRGKVFLFMHTGAEGVSLSMKLPGTNMAALMFAFAQPTGYGLGKSGWVSARFGATDEPPTGLLLAWLDESFRAVAPKRLVKALDAAKE
jgi:predicted DNA-binding protein (MmcQ/YjbR family)